VAKWREGKGKGEAENQAFRPDLYKAQVLMDHANLTKRLAAALRQTKGKLAASFSRLSQRMRPHPDFCVAAGWQVTGP
jgi:hypothetical protein